MEKQRKKVLLVAVAMLSGIGAFFSLILCHMTNYNINKDIGKTVEFEGLKAQYLFIFASGLLGTYPGHFNWRGYLKSQDSLSLYLGRL